MAVKIRLARHGAKKKPFYRVIACESPSPRDGRFLEILGTYDPRDKTSGIKLDLEKIRGWISRGAKLTDTVQKIVNYSERKASTA